MPFSQVFLLFCFLAEPPEGLADDAACLPLSLFLRWFPGGLPFLLYLKVLGPGVLLIPLYGGAGWDLDGICGRSWWGTCGPFLSRPLPLPLGAALCGSRPGARILPFLASSADGPPYFRAPLG